MGSDERLVKLKNEGKPNSGDAGTKELGKMKADKTID